MRFKRFSVLFIIALILGTIFSSIASAAENDHHNLIALGDSITYGYNLGDNSKPSPQAFPNLIEDGDFNVTNLGVPGWTSADLLNSLKTNQIFVNSLKSADVVTLEIGSNDLLQAAGISLQNPAPITITPDQLKPVVDQFALNLQSIIQIIKQQTNAPIILYNLYDPFGVSSDPYLSSLHSLGEQIIPLVNSQVINPMAVQNKLLLADAYTAFNGKQSDYVRPGDIHPTLAGHQALAKLGSKALETLDQSKEDDHSGDDHSGDTHSGDNHSGDDHSGQDNSGQDNSGQDNQGQDTSGQNNQVPTTPTQTETPVQTTTTTLPTPTPAVSDIPVTTNTSTGTNYSLPNTATPFYNYIAAGFILILAGLSTVVIQRKKAKKQVF